MNEEIKKEFYWLKAQISSLEKGIELLKLKLKCCEAENEQYKEELRASHLKEHEEMRKRDY
jgi:hypothetical protein